MPTALSVHQVQSAPSLSGIRKRSLRHFNLQVEDWCDSCRQLSDWEDRNLIDQPTPAALHEHKQLLDELDQVGRWLSRIAQEPDFPDSNLASVISFTVQDLRDRRSLWHGPLSQDERDEILQAIFLES